MDHIKLFDTYSEYETFIDSSDFVCPNVSAITEEYPVDGGLATIPITGLTIGENTIVVSTDEFDANTVTLNPIVAIKKGTSL